MSALLELYREGNAAPSTEAIAERAGISARSLFRYFDDSEALVRTAISRQQEHLAPLFELDVDREAALGDRLGAFVAARVRLLDAMGTVGGVARALAVRQPRIAVELRRIRGVLRSQVVDVFGPELAGRSRADRAATLAALDVLTSWESYHLLREDQRLSRAAAVTAMTTSVRRLLGAVG